MKKLLILIFVLLFISMGAVSAEGNFTQLKHEIDTGIINMITKAMQILKPEF
ncbi:hypothetical protein [uncultured Methanobrevibacter sp.]|uniref:hypothetical protein n=1 Tax=uncultured Methanobrevibacter sp. TaxID=253161 RepID=UPI0025D5D996|nr:hypothetical protein [uncultured Methanobrevibacter sp.]